MPDLAVVDLTPKFLRFYKQAKAVVAGAERWQLWQELYGFAAVPPTPQGKELARQLLDQAWDKYPDHIALFEKGAKAIQPAPEDALHNVCNLLEYQDVAVQLIVFVGGFEDNAFAYAHEGRYHVCIPIEQSPEKRELVLHHEFTHAVHMAKAGLTGSWERSIAQVIIEEGLATRSTEKLVPQHTVADYVGDEAWLQRCQSQTPAIFQGLLPFLANEAAETVYQFTMGQGTTGLTREAYYAGWQVVGLLLEQGRTLADVAGISVTQLPDLVRQALTELIADQR